MKERALRMAPSAHLDYPDEFVTRVKAAYPDDKVLHRGLRKGLPAVQRSLVKGAYKTATKVCPGIMAMTPEGEVVFDRQCYIKGALRLLIGIQTVMWALWDEHPEPKAAQKLRRDVRELATKTALCDACELICDKQSPDQFTVRTILFSLQKGFPQSQQERLGCQSLGYFQQMRPEKLRQLALHNPTKKDFDSGIESTETADPDGQNRALA